jgi:hypothetical protein
MKNVFAAMLALLLAVPAMAQTTRGFLHNGPVTSAGVHNPSVPEGCRGAVGLVQDVGFEGVKTTAHNWSSATGGGESLRYDKTPVLTTKVDLRDGCLNAHFSAIVGSARTYSGVSPVTMFQVTLTPTWIAAPPRHMYGHFEHPYGTYGPAVAIEAEGDVDTFSANFFQRVGTDPTAVPPGTYEVNVWWAGGPAAPGGAIGAAFVLKLYQ